MPVAARAFIDVDANSSGTYVLQRVFAMQENSWWWRVRYNGVWSAWYANRAVTTISTATDWNTLLLPGTYVRVAGAAISGDTNAPVAERVILQVTGDTPGNYVVQTATSLVTGRRYVRVRNAGTWGAWTSIAMLSDIPTSPTDGLANQLLVEDWSRRRGGRKRLTTGAISIRFDHGLANFDTKVRPLMEARNLPYGLAMNAGNWGDAENVGVTTAMVNAWAQGLCEVMNHGRLHTGSKDPAVWTDLIEQGLTDLRSQLPSAQIDGFAIPGTAGVGYGEFTAGSSALEFATPAGRLILARHAYASGYIPGTHIRTLDGRPRNGLGHSTLDQATAASVETLLTNAVTGKHGVQFMLHPSLVDTSSYITTATLTTILDSIAAKRDAGQLAVLRPGDLLLADTTSVR